MVVSITAVGERYFQGWSLLLRSLLWLGKVGNLGRRMIRLDPFVEDGRCRGGCLRESEDREV